MTVYILRDDPRVIDNRALEQQDQPRSGGTVLANAPGVLVRTRRRILPTHRESEGSVQVESTCVHPSIQPVASGYAVCTSNCVHNFRGTCPQLLEHQERPLPVALDRAHDFRGTCPQLLEH